LAISWNNITDQSVSSPTLITDASSENVTVQGSHSTVTGVSTLSAPMLCYITYWN